MKRVLSFILSITLVVCLLPAVAFPAAALMEGYYTYTVSDGKATITDVSTSISGEVTIPSTLGGYPVTSITPAMRRVIFAVIPARSNILTIPPAIRCAIFAVIPARSSTLTM